MGAKKKTAASVRMVRVPAELHKRLRIAAANLDVKISEALVSALDEWLKKKGA